jgi:hypothetical protein
MSMLSNHGALIYCGENDYELADDRSSVWLTVDGVSVWIRRAEELVIVEILRHGGEADGDVLGCCSAPLDPWDGGVRSSDGDPLPDDTGLL